MRDIDAADAGIAGEEQKLDFPDTLEGFKYTFNDSKCTFHYEIPLNGTWTAKP